MVLANISLSIITDSLTGATDRTRSSARRFVFGLFDAIFSRDCLSHPSGEITDCFPFLESLCFYATHQVSVLFSLDLGLLRFPNCADLEIGRRITLSHPGNAQPWSRPPPGEGRDPDPWCKTEAWPLPRARVGTAVCKLSQRPVTRQACRA